MMNIEIETLADIASQLKKEGFAISVDTDDCLVAQLSNQWYIDVNFYEDEGEYDLFIQKRTGEAQLEDAFQNYFESPEKVFKEIKKTISTGEQKAILDKYNIVETYHIDGYVYFYEKFLNRRNFLHVVTEDGVKIGFDDSFRRGFEKIKEKHEKIIKLIASAIKNGATSMEISSHLGSIKFRDKNGELFCLVSPFEEKEEYLYVVSTGKRIPIL